MLRESPIRIINRQHLMTFVPVVSVVHVRNRVEVAYNVDGTKGFTCLYRSAMDLQDHNDDVPRTLATPCLLYTSDAADE